MQLKRNGFVYKVAYDWSSNDTYETSVCTLFWRFLFGFFVVWPLGLLLIFGLILPWGVLALAAVPSFSGETDELYVPIKKWPLKIGGNNISLGMILLAAMVLWMLAIPPLSLMKGASVDTSVWMLYGAVMGTILWMFLVGGGVVLLYKATKDRVERNDGGFTSLLLAYIRAKKQRVCPKVEFVD